MILSRTWIKRSAQPLIEAMADTSKHSLPAESMAVVGAGLVGSLWGLDARGTGTPGGRLRTKA